MTKPPLTVQNAEISTARVEIKTLTVSGKQVTLAVFRQLRDVRILGDDGVLVGEPWGTVNYHPDKCANSEPHWHVVWQRGSDLLRSSVSVAPPTGDFWPDEADRFITACAREIVAGGTTFFNGNPPLKELTKPRGQYASPGVRLIDEAAFPVRMALSEQGVKMVQAWLRYQEALDTYKTIKETQDPVPEWYGTRVTQLEEVLVTEVDALRPELEAFSADARELHAAYRAALDAEAARRRRHVAVREAIAALPQLFIAV